MPRISDMSVDRFPEVPDFVTHYIRDQNLADDDGIQGRTLIRVCLEEFCDEAVLRDTVLMKSAKKDIVASIRRMISDGVVCLLHQEDKPIFRLPREELAAEDVTTIVVEQRDRDAEEAETSLLEEDPPVGEIDVDRHAAGYTEMIRGARPMIEPPAEEDISTPSRKRRRVEIAASDSSSWNSISLSPIRHSNSTPRRRPQPPASPLSGSRRRSAPMQYFSLVKARDTRDYQAEERLRQTLFKREKKDTSPPWLLQGLEGLRSRYADDTFEAENGMIKCSDCGRDFKPANNGVSNFETHLRSKGHRALVAKRIECGLTYQQSLRTKKFDIDYSEQQIPYMVFAQKSQQTLADLRTKYFTAIEGDTHTQSIRLSFLERRLVEADERNVKQREHFEKVVETSERSSKDTKDKFNLLSEVLKSTETKCETKIRDVTDRLDSSESKNAELLKSMKQQIVAFQDSCEKKLDETNTRIAKNLHNLIKSELVSRTKLEQLASQISQLFEINKSQDEEIAKLRSQAEEQKNVVQNLHSQLEEAKKIQEENMQRQCDSDQSFRKTITDQMEAHLQHTERCSKKLAAENQAGMKSMERFMSDRIKSTEAQCSKKFRSLEKKNTEQSSKIERFEHVIPVILDDAQNMREYMEELGNNIAAETDAAQSSSDEVRRDGRKTSLAP
ncbi:uncharacterized protein LY89DRAFT_782148 [Mollisia scopiformis]|uniref:Uncharacterized protein n=1 Tax=Mollisia scopiformis TaxID=149040 RepID=A0A194X9Q9_MOLSC|nr:uncharacterized protein LY89DRAFT_782148 [Mollisia scopiformis]KUJ16903.1 hypothetical protein LY89DRAFT_782148 [Mollisia scopiformis]